MPNIRIITFEELSRRLQPYRCRRLSTFPSGLENWETGWREPFTLWVEKGGGYDEWQYFTLVGGLIAQTMPPNWNGSNGS
jgi:hypothetical protein